MQANFPMACCQRNCLHPWPATPVVLRQSSLHMLVCAVADSTDGPTQIGHLDKGYAKLGLSAVLRTTPADSV